MEVHAESEKIEVSFTVLLAKNNKVFFGQFLLL